MAFSRPTVSAAQGRVNEREWARGLGKPKEQKVVKTPTALGAYVDSLTKDLRNSYNLKKTPKEFIKTEDNLVRVAQRIFAVLDKINAQYLRRNGDDNDSEYRLFKHMLNYWQSVARRGRTPFFGRYNGQTIVYQLSALAALDRRLKKSLS